MTRRQVLWQRSDVPGFEWCELSASGQPTPTRLRGVCVFAWESTPWAVTYAIDLDEHGRTRRVDISAEGGESPVAFELVTDGKGRWFMGGSIVVDEPDALDVDLAFSPATNALPIRRLALAVGESREIGVAWIQFPSFEVEYGRQTYERLADRRWRYESPGFDAELSVDEDGLVESYAEWQAIARS